jgi:hypothetical protein
MGTAFVRDARHRRLQAGRQTGHRPDGIASDDQRKVMPTRAVIKRAGEGTRQQCVPPHEAGH